MSALDGEDGERERGEALDPPGAAGRCSHRQPTRQAALRQAEQKGVSGAAEDGVVWHRVQL